AEIYRQPQLRGICLVPNRFRPLYPGDLAVQHDRLEYSCRLICGRRLTASSAGAVTTLTPQAAVNRLLTNGHQAGVTSRGGGVDAQGAFDQQTFQRYIRFARGQPLQADERAAAFCKLPADIA